MKLKFDDRELITAVVQDNTTRDVLMVAWMNAESLRLTQETSETHFWSRSRNELRQKGATSGNTLAVESINVDCDGDAILITATPAGPTCHTSQTSCFGVEPTLNGIHRLWSTITDRMLERPGLAHDRLHALTPAGVHFRNMGWLASSQHLHPSRPLGEGMAEISHELPDSAALTDAFAKFR